MLSLLVLLQMLFPIESPIAHCALEQTRASVQLQVNIEIPFIQELFAADLTNNRLLGQVS